MGGGLASRHHLDAMPEHVNALPMAARAEALCMGWTGQEIHGREAITMH